MIYIYKYNNFGGFNFLNSIIYEYLEKNKEDVIYKILNRMYVVVMKKVVIEFIKENIDKYREVIDRMKGFKSFML